MAKKKAKIKAAMPFRADLGIHQGVPDPENDTRTAAEKLRHEQHAVNSGDTRRKLVETLNRNAGKVNR